MQKVNNHTVSNPTFFNKTTTHYNLFKEHVWIYIEEGTKTLRNGLKIVVGVTPKYALRLKSAIAGLALISFPALTIKLIDFGPKIKQLLESIRIEDIEGSVLKGLELLMNGVGSLSDLATGWNALSALEYVPISVFFTIISIPLAIGRLSYSVGKSAYDITHYSLHLYTLHKINSLDLLKTYVVANTLSERNIKVWTRHGDKRIVEIMKRTFDTEAEVQAIVQDAKKILQRKIVLESFSTAANLAVLSTLILSTIFSVALPVLLTPILASVQTLTKLLKKVN